MVGDAMLRQLLSNIAPTGWDTSIHTPKMFYGELTNGIRSQGAPKMCYKKQLKCTTKDTKIKP